MGIQGLSSSSPMPENSGFHSNSAEYNNEYNNISIFAEFNDSDGKVDVNDVTYKKNAKEAILDYEVLKYDEKEDVSLVKIDLHTGRHHQIRVQFSSRMHALYGDTKYHGKGGNAQLCLWAYKLSLIHPTTKEELTYIDLPESKGIWKLIEGLNID